jgi:hypothetical protein
VQSCAGAVGTTWLHSNCAPPNNTTPAQLTIVLAAAALDTPRIEIAPAPRAIVHGHRRILDIRLLLFARVPFDARGDTRPGSPSKWVRVHDFVKAKIAACEIKARLLCVSV